MTDSEELLDEPAAPPAAGAPRPFRASHAWLMLIAFLLTQLVVGALVGLVLGLSYSVAGADVFSPEGQHQLDSRVAPWAALAGYAAGFATIVVLGIALASHQLRSRDLAGFGCRAAPLATWIPAALLGATLALGYLGAVESLFPPPAEEELGPFTRMAFSGPLGMAIWISIALLLAPPAEELLFRGMLLSGFRASWGSVPAGVVVTLVFTLTHAMEFVHYWPGAVAVAGFGTLALWLRLRSASLLPPVCAHVAYNAVLVAAAMLDRGPR